MQAVMGASACTRLETACTSPARMEGGATPGVETRISIPPSSLQPSVESGDVDDPQLCGPPSLSQAEKLLLSPLRTRSRAHTRLGAELACDCVQINPRDIRPGTKIGSGTWSVVYAGEWRGAKAALKVFKHAGEDAKEQERRWQMFLKEAQILQELDSPRLVRLAGVFVGTDGCPCLVTELLEGGTLHDLMHGRIKSHKLALEPVHRFLLAVHVAEGLAYLHGLSTPILHRDIKSKNIVLDRRPPDCGPPRAAKIIDFGLADYLDCNGTTEGISLSDQGMHGSAVYMAPECFDTPCCLSVKVDVWALACVLVEVFGGAPPHWECEDRDQVIDKLLVQRVGPDIPVHVDLAAGSAGESTMQELLQACLTFTVAERYSSAEVLAKLQDTASKLGIEPSETEDIKQCDQTA